MNELEQQKGEGKMVRPQLSFTLRYLLLIVLITSACGVGTSGTMATQVPVGQTQPVEAPSLDVTTSSIPTSTKPPQPSEAPTLEDLPSEVPVSTEPPVFEEIFDGRISIKTTNVETTTDPLADYELPASGNGNQYIIFKLTVSRIEDIHLVNIMGFEEERPTLQLADGQIYDILFSQFTGVQFTDPTDITSPVEFVEGAEGVLIFEVPENGIPVTIILPYSYQHTWEDETPTRGEIKIVME